jgi:hypothetical protein
VLLGPRGEALPVDVFRSLLRRGGGGYDEARVTSMPGARRRGPRRSGCRCRAAGLAKTAPPPGRCMRVRWRRARPTRHSSRFARTGWYRRRSRIEDEALALVSVYEDRSVERADELTHRLVCID